MIIFILYIRSLVIRNSFWSNPAEMKCVLCSKAGNCIGYLAVNFMAN